jgi:hypothetical protein
LREKIIPDKIASSSIATPFKYVIAVLRQVAQLL